MIKKLITSITLVATIAASASVYAAGGNIEPPKQQNWHFDGAKGTFDRKSIRRGFNVYKNVCAGCHGLRLLSYRNLQQVGFSESEVKNIAKGYDVPDLTDDGEDTTRPAIPSDKFVSPYPNERAARSVNNNAFPPDLSLIIKARADGANYLYSLLTGYNDAPEGFELSEGMSYNPYFSNKQIAMSPPLSDDAVEYADGTKATVDQMSKDVVNFLQWAAEPEMEERKRMGFKVLIFLSIFTILFYAAKIRTWNRLKEKD